MSGASTIDGKLHVYAEFPIRNAPMGQWPPERYGKLLGLIKDFVNAAEAVDVAEREIDAKPLKL